MGMLNTLLKAVKDKSPSILTGISIGGVIVTSIIALKTGPKLERHVSIAKTVRKQMVEEGCTKDEMKKQRIKNGLVYLRDLSPVLASAAVTIGCGIAANKINLKRNAALAAACTVFEGSYKDILKTVKPEERESIQRERATNEYFSKTEPAFEGTGDTLCYETYSGRYFYCTRERINIAKMKANERLAKRGDCSLNYFYHWLGIETIPLGNNVGWTTSGEEEGVDWINFRNDSFLVKGDIAVLWIDYSVDSLPTML